MIFLSLGLFAFALTDLTRGPLDKGTREGEAGSISTRLGIGVLTGASVAAGVAALAGLPLRTVAVIAAVGAVVLAVWVYLDFKWGDDRPLAPLAWIGGVLVVLFAISSLGEPVEGPLRDWYEGLDFNLAARIGVDQFVLGSGAALFAVASCNRMVVLLLALTGTPSGEEESGLKGGRFLGPMERLLVGAVILAGDPAAAAIVIAAKGLLRFPEIRHEGAGGRDEETGRSSPDERTEYFLIGTISSLLLAAFLAGVVSASR